MTAIVLLMLGGCTRISVDPNCPTEVEVGQTIDLAANATNEGGIATFQWTVEPEAAGELATPTRPDTDFTPMQAGPATIRLVASDGLFTSTAECQVQIGAGGLIVQLSFAPAEPRTRDLVTLTCRSIGGITAEELEIVLDDGPEEVELTPSGQGRATFTPTMPGDYSFTCTGTAGNDSSDPAAVTVRVTSTRPPR